MRRFRTILIAVVAILAIVALGLMVAQDQETLRVRSAHTADDPRFVQYVAALAGGSFTRGDTYRVLTNGDEVFPAMLDTITRARRRISFESYNYSTGQVATDFTRELAAAARRGVEVRVLIDAIGASDMSDEDKQTLESAGCRVVAYNPTRWYSLETVNYRTHRKILVVDEEIGFLGGVGLDDQWLGHAQDKDHWRDTHVMLTGPGVRELEAGFYENWIEAGHEGSRCSIPPRRRPGARSRWLCGARRRPGRAA